MSKQNYIQSTFGKGMVQDILPERQPGGTYNYALNAVHQSKDYSGVFTNEESNDLWATVPGTIVGGTFVEERNMSVYFSSDGGIYTVSHEEKNKVELVMKDSEAECDWGFGSCEFVYGVFKNMQPCSELHVYFSANCEYYVVNIDEMLSEERRGCALKEGCDYFKLFRCICGPKITPIPVEGGGFLPAGSYQFIAQLEDNDGNRTNWFDLTQPVYVGSDNNIGGEIGNWSIKVQVDQLERGYTSLNIAVIKRIKGVPSAELLPPIAYNSKSVTYEYYGDNPDTTDILIEEVLIKGKKYLRGKDLMQKDGRLFLYSIRQDILPNYQKYANEANTEWVEFEVSAESQARYHFPSLQRGENYAVGIVLKFCDGTYSHVFHIPASPEGGSGGGSGSSVEKYHTLGGNPIVQLAESFDLSGVNVSTYPYEEKFNEVSTWQNKGSYDWTQSDQPTPTLDTGPSGGSTGEFYAYAKSQGNKDKEAVYQSPVFDLSSSEQATLTFDYHLYGPNSGTLTLKATVDGDNYYPIWSKTGNQGDQWKSAVVPLPQFAGTFVGFQFTTTSLGNQGDVGISNIFVQALSGSGGGSSQGSVPSSKQYDESTYDKSNSFTRDRGPECDDTDDTVNPNLEKAIQDDINNIDASEQDAKDAIGEFADYLETPKLKEIVDADLDDASNMVQNAIEQVTAFSEDEVCPPLNEKTSIKDAAKDLIQKGVINREYDKLRRSAWVFDKGPRYLGGGAQGLGAGGGSSEDPDGSPQVGETKSKGNFNPGKIEGTPFSMRGDQWVDAYGQDVTEESPVELNSNKTEVYESNIPYPDICDCEGNRMFPEGNIRHHKMPDNCESTHYVSNVVGVVHKKDGTNTEWNDTFVRLLGLKISNIYLPKDEELPKPLCPLSPFKIVIAKRDSNDRTIIAKGLTTSCFTGQVHGREHAFPKHGVNSFECVDRYIENGDSKIGVNSSPNCYNFHSLDTNAQKIPLPVQQFKNYMELYGSGWRHGLYAKGKAPDQWFSGTRIDQRGARQSISLPGQACSLGEADISGITYAPANSVVSGQSLPIPLMNRLRESSVYMVLDNPLPPLQNGKRGDESDSSFVGDTLDHEAPIKTAAGWYGALYRDIPDQYGTVENMRYIDSGINATIAHGQSEPGSRVTISGITGDVFIGPYSIKRTGYVSNKVGNKFPIKNGSDDGRTTPWKRDRDICDHPWDLNYQYLGLDHYPTRLPESGDIADGKNWAGLHTTDINYSAEGASDRTAPDSDFYYPKVQKTLITYWGEFEINPYFRQTGVGPQVETGEVFYPKLKDLYLDSSDSEDHPWEECFLNRFYTRVEQPSKATLSLKSMIRSAIGLFTPAWISAMTIQLESVPDTALAFVVLPLLAAVWTFVDNAIFSDEWVDKMLGIPRCKNDEEGGEDETCDRCPHVVQFEDNYHKYQFDFSKRNDIQSFYGIPRNYNTCVCDNCIAGDTTQEIYYSEKQPLTSQIDSYRNFKANNYLAIPAHAGQLKRLVVESNRFYAHTTDGLWLLQYNNVSIPSSTGNIIMGKGDLLADPQLIMESIAEGYAGLQDRNAAISCAAGYVWPDAEGDGIYRMFQGQMEKISDYGMKHFFDRSLNFCNPLECRDEKVAGVYYSIGYDPRYDRILFTKKDGDACSSWTASYDPTRKVWISFHSYLPMMYMWDRSDFYSVRSGTGEVWLHDSGKNFQTYYGSYQPFVIDFVVRQEHGEPWRYDSTMLDTEARLKDGNGYLYERHQTFNEAGMWNGTQSTGMRRLEVRSDSPDTENNLIDQMKQKTDSIEAVYTNSQWRINEFYNFIVDVEARVTTKTCDCSPFENLVEGSTENLHNQTMDDRVLHQRYMFYRYILNNNPDLQLYLKSNITKITEQVR